MADRYQLGAVLGRGALSTVYSAVDTRSGRVVVVKVLQPGADRAHARELAALRFLDEPGVARLLDHGSLHDGRMFLALEPFEGQPFPGVASPIPWTRVAPLAASLLETLHRVHRCGVVHGDLSPDNVLVDEEGRLHLVDFGAARLLDARPDPTPTTVAFASPERLAGGAPTQRSDLFSAAALVVRAMIGALPWEREDLASLDRRVPLHLPELPPAVDQTLRRMLAAEPMLRPATALDALEGLTAGAQPELPFIGWRDQVERAAELLSGDELVRVAIPAGGGRSRFLREVALLSSRVPVLQFVEVTEEAEVRPPPLDASSVQALFTGPEALLWLRSDAAHEVLRRTRGWPGEVGREVLGWLRLGLARWEGGRVAVGRTTLDRLGASLVAEELRELVSAARQSDPDAFFVAARTVADRLDAEGRTATALALAETVLAETGKSSLAAVPLVYLAVEIACYANDPSVVSRVRGVVPESEDSLHALLDAAESGRAEGVPLLPNERLDAARIAMRVNHVLRRHDEAELDALSADVAAWASRWGTSWTAARRAGWDGQIAYQRGDYVGAARAHHRSATGRHRPVERLSAVLNAGSALLEAGQYEEAATVAAEALALAREVRHAFYAGRATWLRRAASYRMGRDSAVDEEIAVVLDEYPYGELAAFLALTEAAIAWRALDTAQATRLAELARDRSPAGEAPARLLADALVAACVGATSGAASDLIERVGRCPLPAIGVQALGLLASSGAPLDRDARDLARRMADRVPSARRVLRLEVLSVREALELVEAVV